MQSSGKSINKPQLVSVAMLITHDQANDLKDLMGRLNGFYKNSISSSNSSLAALCEFIGYVTQRGIERNEKCN